MKLLWINYFLFYDYNIDLLIISVELKIFSELNMIILNVYNVCIKLVFWKYLYVDNNKLIG